MKAWLSRLDADLSFAPSSPEEAADGGIVRESSGETAPVSAAGIMDRLALGMDRIKENLTSKATRR